MARPATRARGAQPTGYTLAPEPQLLDVARYRVLFADCDPMRIMYYGSYFRLFEIGRAELFRMLGHPFPEYIAQGLYLAVIETQCRYLRPARYDDELILRAGVTEVHGARLTIRYQVVHSNGDIAAEGFTEHAVVNEAGRPRRIPRAFRDAALAASATRTCG